MAPAQVELITLMMAALFTCSRNRDWDHDGQDSNPESAAPEWDSASIIFIIDTCVFTDTSKCLHVL